MEAVLRWRGPLTAAVAAIVLVEAVALLSAALSAPESGSGLAAAVATLGTPVVALAALVGWSVGRPTPRSAAHAVVAALASLVAVGVAATTALVLWQPSAAFDRLALSGTCAISTLGLIVVVSAAAHLLRIDRRGEQPTARTAPGTPEITSTGSASGAAPRLEEPEPEPVVREQPVWEPDEAAGAVWLSAADAAAGAAGRQSQPEDGGWGSPVDPGPRALPPGTSAVATGPDGPVLPVRLPSEVPADRPDQRPVRQAPPDWSAPSR